VASDQVVKLLAWWEDKGPSWDGRMLHGDMARLLSLAKLGAAAIRKCEAWDEALRVTGDKTTSSAEVRTALDAATETSAAYTAARAELEPR
jgi:hypothetical protein